MGFEVVTHLSRCCGRHSHCMTSSSLKPSLGELFAMDDSNDDDDNNDNNNGNDNDNEDDGQRY
jgi:hypothetical protein